jgi:hypothetical protein
MTNDQKEDPRLLPAPALKADRAPGDIEGEYWRWCPRCHYFLSCSDFD